MPSAISRRKCGRWARGTCGSAILIARSDPAETRKLAASAITAYGAVNACTRNPPSAGPATWATDSLAWSLALPSTSAVRPTRAGRYDW